MKDRIEKMRGRAFAVPFVVGIAIFCVLGLSMAPMFSAAPKEVPMAIVNLDEGAVLPNGEETNAGTLIVEKMTTAAAEVGEDGEAPIAWTELSSRQALDEAMEDGAFYGAVVIPRDFTQRQMADRAAVVETLQEQLPSVAAAAAQAQANPQAQAQAAQGLAVAIAQAQQSAEKPSVDVVLNLAKSPMLAQTMQASLTGILSQAGIQPDVETIGEAPGGDSGPLASMMSVQFMVMPLFIMSLIMGIAGSLLLWRKQADRSARGRAALLQLVYCVLASLVAAVCSYGMVAWLGGVAVDASAILFLWLASFCLTLVTVGLCDIAVPLGALVMLCVFALGMSAAVLPAPMLPAFWVDWVLPWAPQNYIGEGLRNIIYLGGGVFGAGAGALLAWGAVGLLALVCAVLSPSRKVSEPSAEDAMRE